jgi:uncharacterized membrane protein
VRTLIAIVVILVILIIGGGLTSMLMGSSGAVLPILTTTTVPDASPTIVLPWKAEQFFLLVGFIVFNLVGIALTLAVIFWAVDRGLKRSRTSANNTPAAMHTAAAEE